jgi:hypothetical protein
MIGVADDHPRTGAENRGAAGVQGLDRRLQPGRLDSLANRRALAAGDDQAVETVNVGGSADLGCFGAELAQGEGVRFEVALQG